MIHKFTGVARATSSAPAIEGLVWGADRRHTSSGRKATIIHITRTGAPEILRYTMLLNSMTLNFQSLSWRIHRNYKRRLCTTSKTTSALLQGMVIPMQMISTYAETIATGNWLNHIKEEILKVLCFLGTEWEFSVNLVDLNYYECYTPLCLKSSSTPVSTNIQFFKNISLSKIASIYNEREIAWKGMSSIFRPRKKIMHVVRL